MTTVLIIEDEQQIRENVAEILTYGGYNSIQAENGLVGVTLAAQHQPDLIICDVMMPEMDGFEVLHRLQSDSSTAVIPFIFLTALADKQHVRYGMDLGADDYLTKPFTPDELLRSIQTRLAKHISAVDHYKTIEMRAVNTGDSRSGSPGTVMPSLIGHTIHGYQFWEKIGEGGAGVVYKAYQPAIGREVAIKVLRQKYADNTEFIHRFQTEAELVARLEHPHIIPLYDYWENESGVFIVMRWLRGGSLRRILEQHGAWDLTRTATVLDQVTDALSVAHSVSIIHRDLKPDNILLDERGNTYLTDFGLAKNLFAGTNDAISENDLRALLEAQKHFFQQEMSSTLYITDAQQLAGTPAYLPPEQILGEPLSPQSDMYSLGIMLYEMLVGDLPFSGTLGEVVTAHLRQPLPSVSAQRPDVPQAVDEVLQKATAKEVRERYPDVLTFASDFRRAFAR